MPRPRNNLHPTDTRDRILAAAEARFAAQGLAPARLEDIAADAGIRRPSLLYHFPTKETLYAEVIHRGFAALGAALSEGLHTEGDFAARLDAVEAAYLHFVAARPAFAALLLREILDGQGPGRALLLDAVVPLLDQLDTFLETQGQGALKEGLPRRALLLQVATAALVHAAAGPLQAPLWGDPPTLLPTARRLFLL